MTRAASGKKRTEAMQKLSAALNGDDTGILAVSAAFLAQDATEGNGSPGSGAAGGSGGGSGNGGSRDYYDGISRGGKPARRSWDGAVMLERIEKKASRLPVLLDLNGDNHIDFRPFDAAEFAAGQGPRFDWDGDGIGDGIAWAGPSDGWLAIDVAADGSAGPDGVINQAKELAFTMWKTPDELAGEQAATSDLEALQRVFDTNQNKQLDPGDARWSEFRVWQDVNQNGVNDAGELRTLEQADIRLIDLTPSSAGARQFADGSAITGTSAYLKGDGSRGLVGDAMVAYSSAWRDGKS